MNILGILAILTLQAWDSSAELRERHHDDLTDYHQRILRQAMECDVDEGEYPALITDVLNPQQVAHALQLAGGQSI